MAFPHRSFAPLIRAINAVSPYAWKSTTRSNRSRRICRSNPRNDATPARYRPSFNAARSTVQIRSTASKPSTTKAFSFETRNVIRASGKLSRIRFTAGSVKATSPIDFHRMTKIFFTTGFLPSNHSIAPTPPSAAVSHNTRAELPKTR